MPWHFMRPKKEVRREMGMRMGVIMRVPRRAETQE
jgi:hypothetical protein